MSTRRTKDIVKIKPLIINELPRLFEEDQQIRKSILNLTKDKYSGKKETEDRIDKILKELKADRERQDKRWEEWKEEDRKRWEEWKEEDRKRWEENNKKWWENQRVLNEMVKSINKRIDSTIGALGARWGLHSEESFRNGLKAILEESFNVKVEHYSDYDNDGKVFGRPEQIELDMIIYNRSLILCEIKSSMSKSDMYTFWRKREFYEKRHNRKVDRMIVISPMVEPKAKEVAKELGIDVYSYSEDVKFSN